jgi:hypothetical protein
MAAITKAAFKAGSRSDRGKKTNCFAFVISLVFGFALFNFFVNEPGYGSLVEGVEKSISDSVKGTGNGAGTAAIGSVTNSGNINGGSKVVASTTTIGSGTNSGNLKDGSKVVDPFYPEEVDDRHLSYIFHHTPTGRMGKEGHVILDMLLAHSYAFHSRQIYGGSCGAGNDVGRDPERSLIKAVGLEDVIRFACPDEIDSPLRKREIPSKSYIQDGTRALTPEYITLLRSVTTYPERKDNQYTIVVHIRRGKLTPCRKPVHDVNPYLPNMHYQVSLKSPRQRITAPVRSITFCHSNYSLVIAVIDRQAHEAER